MIKIKHKLKEKFFDADKIKYNICTSSAQYTEFYINPSSKEIRETFQLSRDHTIRGLITIKGDLLIWNSDLIHYYAIKGLEETEKGKKFLSDNHIKIRENSWLFGDTFITIIIHSNLQMSFGEGCLMSHLEDIDMYTLYKNFKEKNHSIDFEYYILDQLKLMGLLKEGI